MDENVGAERAAQDYGGDQQRPWRRQREKAPPRHPGGPEDRQGVGRAPQAPGESGANNAEPHGQSPKNGHKRHEFEHAQFAGQVRPALALQERETDKGQPGHPHSREEELCDGRRDKGEIGADPIPEERRREDDRRRANGGEAIRHRRKRARRKRIGRVAGQAGHAGKEGASERHRDRSAPQNKVHRHAILRNGGDPRHRPDDELVYRGQRRIDHIGGEHPAAIPEQLPRRAPIERAKRKRSFQTINENQNDDRSYRLRSRGGGNNDRERGADEHSHDHRGDLRKRHRGDLDQIDQQEQFATFQRPRAGRRNKRQRQKTGDPGKRPGDLRAQFVRHRNEMFEQKSAEYIEDSAADQANAQVEAERRQQHPRALGLRRLAQLRQGVGDRAREPEIEKSEQSQEHPYDRDHAITRLADMAQIDRNRHKRDGDPHRRIQKIDDEIRFQASFRHTHPSGRDIGLNVHRRRDFAGSEPSNIVSKPRKRRLDMRFH